MAEKKIYTDRFGNQFYYENGKKVMVNSQQPTAVADNTKSVPSLEEFINERIDCYLKIKDIVANRGVDIADLSFYLGGWITSYVSFARNGK